MMSSSTAALAAAIKAQADDLQVTVEAEGVVRTLCAQVERTVLDDDLERRRARLTQAQAYLGRQRRQATDEIDQGQARIDHVRHRRDPRSTTTPPPQSQGDLYGVFGCVVVIVAPDARSCDSVFGFQTSISAILY